MTGNYFIISVQITSWITKQPLVIDIDQAKHDLILYNSCKGFQPTETQSLESFQHFNSS